MQSKFNVGEVIVTKKRVSVITGMSLGTEEKELDNGEFETVPFVRYTTGDGFEVDEKDILGTIEKDGK